MSDSEKAAQVGEAMLLFENQRRELAHLAEKIDKVKKAYRTFSSQSARWSVDASRPTKVFLSHPEAEERDLASYLFAESDLASLVTEYQQAEEALRGTKAKLAGFGVML
jgi:hypothetical protein